jgi:DNA processing protein
MVLEVLGQDAALEIDEILDLVEAQLSSAEVFTALFELELAGRIRSLPGKNCVRGF